jgi:hypothetical protein
MEAPACGEAVRAQKNRPSWVGGRMARQVPGENGGAETPKATGLGWPSGRGGGVSRGRDYPLSVKNAALKAFWFELFIRPCAGGYQYCFG